jgi:hypothetical protein
MDAFQPVINLLMLMSALSVAAERLANAVKLGNVALSEKRAGGREEKEREHQIARRVLVVSILVAVIVRADFFAILAHLEAPWGTLGWVPSRDAGRTASQLIQEAAGMIVTGFALGFGSKFWHDALDMVRRVRAERRP